jgi:hypothetical protein
MTVWAGRERVSNGPRPQKQRFDPKLTLWSDLLVELLWSEQAERNGGLLETVTDACKTI